MKRSDFPSDFIFGTATSSYQIEGTKLGKCGPNHWDAFAKAGGVVKGENGDIACAHYEHWQSDLDLIAACGMDAYRFSTAWPRVLPEGKGAINVEGLNFYDGLVDGLLARGIEPHLTLYHWDLPQALADKGGWTNRDTALYFAEYSELVTRKLGDRLKSIATINEPWCVSWLSHFLGHHAPGLQDLSAAAKAMHHILLAHGQALDAIRPALPTGSDCKLGIVLNMEVSHPNSDSEADLYAAQIQDGIYNRWFADAVFNGTYPEDVLEHLADHMPKNWQADMACISQPMDWLGLNYYTRSHIEDDGTGQFPYARAVVPNYDPKDQGRTSMNWEIFPDGLSGFLTRIQERYAPDIPIFVSENGMASFDHVQDSAVYDAQRVGYFEKHLGAVQDAIAAGVPVKGYFAWSLLDNFEWAFGYDQRFGIIHVDFETQHRTPKASWRWFQELLGS